MGRIRLDKNRGAVLWVGMALLLAAVLKVSLVAADRVPFNADEAVVALMARHILAGEHPVFFYGQAYLGSLDAYLVAGAFAIFGQQVWAIRLVQGLLYLGTLGTTGWLGKKAFGSTQMGIAAMLLLSIPAVNVTLYTTASLGGYGEALLIGNFILLCTLYAAEPLGSGKTGNAEPIQYPVGKWLPWFGSGFLTGLGLWAFGLTLVYSVPAALYLFAHLLRYLRNASNRRSALRFVSRCIVLGSLGLILGSSPWWGYALANGAASLLSELGGGAIAGIEKMPWIAQVVQHVVNLVLFGFTAVLGLRPPWEVRWLGLPLLPFIFIFWMAVIVYTFRVLRKKNQFQPAQILLAGVGAALLVGFVFTPFGADPSGRYFIVLVVPMALFAASMIVDLNMRFGRRAIILLALILVYHLWGTVQCALRFPPGLTTQFYEPARVDHRYMPDLVEFLREQGETRGYTNYWVGYPLAFLSQEELIFIPRLPYHPDFRYTERDDRYAPYDEMVAQADKAAYITTHHPDLDDELRRQFTALGISWQEQRIGDYQIFYALSRLVRPHELGLGVTTP